MRWKLAKLWCNLLAFVLLVCALSLVYVWPEHLAALSVTSVQGKLLILHLSSLLLLLGAFQRNLGGFWRKAALTGAFFIMGEATLLAILLPVA